MRLRIGTRASALARWQADWVAAELSRRGTEVELVPITTTGDRDQGPIGTLGTAGVFTKEIQRALLDRRIDLAVHSLKDLPTEPVPGLALAAVPLRAAPWDTLIFPQGRSLEELPAGAAVGTSSLRRRAQLRHLRPDLELRDIRGNVDTRLRKLEEGAFQALILALAGLERLGLADRATAQLRPPQLLPAVGQGALGLETRDDDCPTRDHLEPLNDAQSFQAVVAERAMLAALHGGCLTPVAAWARIESGQLVLSGRVLSLDGREQLDATATAAPNECTALGQHVAELLLAQGAARLIQAARQTR
jgi:hydroxymethylbilane synthase